MAQQRTEYEESVKQAERKTQQVRLETEKFESNAVKKQRELDNSLEELRKLKELKKQMENEQQRIKKDLDDERKKSSNEKIQFNLDRQKLNDEKHNLKCDIEKLKMDANNRERELENAKRKISIIELDSFWRSFFQDAFKTQTEKISSEAQQFKKEATRYEQDYQNEKRVGSKLQTETKNLKNDLQAEKKKNMELDTRKRDLEIEVSNKKAEIARMEKSINNHIAKEKEYEEYIQKKKLEFESKEAKLMDDLFKSKDDLRNVMQEITGGGSINIGGSTTNFSTLERDLKQLTINIATNLEDITRDLGDEGKMDTIFGLLNSTLFSRVWHIYQLNLTDRSSFDQKAIATRICNGHLKLKELEHEVKLLEKEKRVKDNRSSSEVDTRIKKTLRKELDGIEKQLQIKAEEIKHLEEDFVAVSDILYHDLVDMLIKSCDNQINENQFNKSEGATFLKELCEEAVLLASHIETFKPQVEIIWSDIQVEYNPDKHQDFNGRYQPVMIKRFRRPGLMQVLNGKVICPATVEIK